MKLFNYLIIGIVVVAIVAGFFVLGTPQSERLRRLDDQRVRDLQNIQWQVINYWQAKTELPANLDMLVDETSGFRPPVDPETIESYGYNIKDAAKLTFELCADFKATSRSSSPPGNPKIDYYDPIGWNWLHPASHFCFERTIDPEQYPPNKKIIE